MADLIVHGGAPLHGRITPSANKNAVLPILCATLLTREPVRLRGITEITDVKKILEIFRMLGSRVEVDFSTGILDVHHRDTLFDETRHRLPEEMRSSIMLVPGLMARFGAARIENDVKGCSLGAREIDPHIDVFERFGGRVERSNGAIVIRIAGALQASSHWMDYASVTTTENFVLCAALAQGTSTMINAASEPHVQEFCQFMTMLGARIEGIGTSSLKVHGVDRLGGGDFTFAEDFHEIVTFLALGAITGGEVTVKNSTPEQFPLLDRTFAKFGVHIEHRDGWSRNVNDGPLRVKEPFTQNILQKVEAAPWPYVPVDLLPIFVTLGVKAQGQCMFWNKVYDGAMGWTAELSRFGAHAFLADPHRIITFGGKPLQPATVESPYIIRAAIAMLMLACSIPGQSRIKQAAPIKRAHPHFAENITRLGARVEWIEGD